MGRASRRQGAALPAYTSRAIPGHMQRLLFFAFGAACGLGTGAILFRGSELRSPPREASLSQPARSNGAIEGADSPKAHRLPPPTGEVTPEPKPPPGEFSPPQHGNPESPLQEQLTFDQRSFAELKGQKPVEPPEGLPEHFARQQSVADYWKARLKGTRFETAAVTVNCDEYPCYARISGVGPEALSEALQTPRPDAFAGAAESAMTFGRNVGDGGTYEWTAGIATFPSEEPASRQAVIAARLEHRMGGHSRTEQAP